MQEDQSPSQAVSLLTDYFEVFLINSFWASRSQISNTQNQPLATQLAVGFLGSLGPSGSTSPVVKYHEGTEFAGYGAATLEMAGRGERRAAL
jgi:hypothetical protein